MDKNEAIGIIADGHGMISVSAAKEVCEAFGVSTKGLYITRWKSQADANPGNHPKGLFLNEDKPGEGVATLTLSYFVAGKLGLREGKDYQTYFGRGSQADAIAAAVKEFLKL